MNRFFYESRASTVYLDPFLFAAVVDNVFEDRPPPSAHKRTGFTPALSPSRRFSLPERRQAFPGPTGLPPGQAARWPRLDPAGTQRGAAMRRLRGIGRCHAPLRVRDLRRRPLPRASRPFPRGGARRVDVSGPRDRRGRRSRRALLLCLPRSGLRSGLRRGGRPGPDGRVDSPCTVIHRPIPSPGKPSKAA